jgi:hypothetical protein
MIVPPLREDQFGKSPHEDLEVRERRTVGLFPD